MPASVSAGGDPGAIGASARRTCGRRGRARRPGSRRPRRARARRSGPHPRGGPRSSRRAAAGRPAAPRPGSRRAASSCRRARTSVLSSEPWKRSIRTRSATSSSRQATSPPSPRANRFFVGKKLNVEQTPVLATPAAPNACAASSISGRPSAAELGEGGGAAEEVHGHDRLRPRRDPRGDVLGIEVEGDGIDVGEHGRGADAGDRLGRGIERERRDRSPRRPRRSPSPRARGRARRCRSRRRSRAARRDRRPIPARTPRPRDRR